MHSKLSRLVDRIIITVLVALVIFVPLGLWKLADLLTNLLRCLP